MVHGSFCRGRPTGPHPGSHEGKKQCCFVSFCWDQDEVKRSKSNVKLCEALGSEFHAGREANNRKLSKITVDIDVVFEFP